jgi:IPT/TIG domain/FG-GAP-like repeat/Secretion system C-terminal sorting domain
MKSIYLKTAFFFAFLITLNNAKSQVIFSENFEGTFPPAGWSFTNTGGNPWTSFPFFNASNNTTNNLIACTTSGSSNSNTWAITPQLNMTTNSFYRISYFYRNRNNAINENLRITIGNANNVLSQTQTIHNYSGFTSGTSLIEGIDTITVAANGNYYIGFNCYSFGLSSGIYVDSIVVKKIIPTTCSGVAISGTASALNIVGINSPFTLSLSGNYGTYSGLQFQWQSSLLGANSFQNIIGGATQNFITSQNLARDYRCIVSCSNGGSAYTSNIISVSIPSSGGLFRQKYAGSTDVNKHIRGMSFLTPAKGIVAFNNSIGYTLDSGQTYITRPVTNSNVNFNGYAVNLTFGFNANGVHAFSQDSILLYGDYGAEPSILFSANQGVSWKLVYHEAFNQDINNTMFDMKFPSTTLGTAISQKYLVQTTDRGQTWVVKITIPSTAISLFAKLSAPTATTLYAIAGNLLYYASGASWQLMNLPPNTGLNFNTVSFLPSGIGYLVKDDTHGIYKITGANSGGVIWTLMNDANVIGIDPSDMHFINDSTGFAATKFTYNVVKTTNSGETWEVCKKNTNYQIAAYGMDRLFFLNKDIAWAGGRGEYLMMTTTGGNPTIPKAYFKIDTTNLTPTGTVYLINKSQPYYQYKWYKNNVLISTAFNASYTHDLFTLRDTIKLIVNNGVDLDSLELYQDFPPYSQVPIINSFIPNTGTFNTTVNISGLGFTGASSVTFGGIQASSFVVNSNTSITAIVGGGSSGNVAITTTPGTGSASGFIFTMPVAPIISSFSPANGPIGTTVTITGNNFNTTAANNIVYFGKMKAVINSSNATQIICTVPPGTSFNPIVVLNLSNRLSASSTKPFTVTFAGDGIVHPYSFLETLLIPLSTLVTNNTSLNVNTFDIDNDGKNDIISNSINNTISYFRNNSTLNQISFENRIQIGNGSYETLSIGDLDNDGKNDIIGRGNNTIEIFKNNSAVGNIFFSPPFYVPSGAYAKDVAVRDVDGDGRSDLIYVTGVTGDEKMSVARNVSTSLAFQFAPKIDFAASTNTINRLIDVGDLNGDGKVDVVVAAGNQISIFPNTSTIENISFGNRLDFTTNSNIVKIKIADVDNDNKLDIIITYYYNSNAILVLRNTTQNNGPLSFSPIINTAGNTGSYDAPLTSTVDNLTGDLLPDFITGNDNPFTTFNFVYKNNSANNLIRFDTTATLQNTRVWTNAASDLDGDGKPEIILAGGNSNSENFKIFKNRVGEIFPVPTITSFTPTTGHLGTPIIITGTNFVNVTFVTIGGITATNFTVNSPTQITVNSGYVYASGSISVSNYGGTATLAGFTFIPYPTITSFTPDSARIGNTVTITGTNFIGVLRVFFGGTLATSFNTISPTTITATVANGTSGDLRVEASNGPAQVSGFTYIPNQTTITAFSPSTGTTGTVVTINGFNFNGASSVKFGGVEANSFTILSPTRISAVVGLAGSSDIISVTTPSGTGVSFPFTFINPIPTPTITSFTPATGINGTLVTITGTNFTNTTSVKFGGIAATSFTLVSATSITAIVANGATGSVTVTTAGGTATALGFTFISAPSIVSFTPTSAASGIIITITGTNFTNTSAVSIGGVAATSFIVTTPTTISAVVAGGASGNVVVTTPGGSATLGGFNYISAIAGLVSFSGSIQNNIPNLKWQTLNEQNIANFVLERSLDSLVFTAINTTIASGTPNILKDYSFNDIAATAPKNYYRLKMISLNGIFIYSQIIALGSDAGILAIYPNPAHEFVLINHPKNIDGNAQLILIDGRGVAVKTIAINKNSLQTRISVKNFAKGVYTVTWKNLNEKNTSSLIIE